MSLTDTDEAHIAGEELRFRMTDGARRVVVRISQDALDDVQARSGVTGFEAHRAAFAALATRKYAKGDREADGSIIVRPRDI